MKPNQPIVGNFFPAAALACLLAASSLCAQDATKPAAATTSAASDEAVVLSPFQVDASSDKGYMATQTLSGTRLKTDLRDIGSALTPGSTTTPRVSGNRTKVSSAATSSRPGSPLSRRPQFG
jgi:hypothetical protein